MSEGTDTPLRYDYKNYIIKLKRNQMITGTGVINISLFVGEVTDGFSVRYVLIWSLRSDGA